MSTPFEDPASLNPDQIGAFARAFVTARYLLDHRGAQLAQGLMGAPVLRGAEATLSQLGHPERKIRLAALTTEVAALAQSLQQRALPLRALP
ncbi:MAG TPA: hypothetical protein VL137_12730 [Polyangiaceae bacterium]|jgi:hypothetical protein|nr:hypothetical protein [Polyangiaceae bacterium]